MECDKDTFSNGETVKLKISVDNTNSKVGLSGFKFVLVSEYRLKDDEGVIHNTERIVNITKTKCKVAAGFCPSDHITQSCIPLKFPQAKR
mmetsp:Transcript_18966/g.29366  ORF Transcript_18966/g.29366 Transcript_18966/m.29366 type:complete len:90 (+) Transcript_18966:200-469(+)